MIVECGKCSTKFKIGDEKVTTRGVKVRCSKCKHVFVVKKGGLIEPVAPPSAPPAEAKPAIKDDIPEDIFRVPTRVSPPPADAVASSIPSDIFPVPSPGVPAKPAPPAAKGSTLPPPPKPPLGVPGLPTDRGRSLADKIDLDSDDISLPPPQPLSAPQAMSFPPPQKAATSEGDLFGDLLKSKPAEAGASMFPAGPVEKPAAPPAVESKPAFLDDDPFADIDISSPGPAQVPPDSGVHKPRTPDPASGPAVGKPTQDLFDGLSDPFAGLGAPAPTPAPAVSAPQGELPAELSMDPTAHPAADAGSIDPVEDDPFQFGGPGADAPASAPPEAAQPAGFSPDDDPFAGIDITSGGAPPAPGVDGGDAGAIFGDNDLSQLDDAAGAAGGTPMPSGLELDQDGKLIGEALAPPEPPLKTVRSEDTARVRREEAPMAAPPPPPPIAEPIETQPSGVLWAYKLGFGLIALALALFLFVAYRTGGNPDLTSWSTYVEAFTGKSDSEVAATELLALGLNNTAYENLEGHELVVLWGEVKNTTEEHKQAVTIRGKLVDQRGSVLNEFSAPAGISFTPVEVYQMSNHVAVEDAYRSRLPKVADLKIPPGEAAPFMLIFYQHPEEMDGIEFRVLPAVSKDPLRGLPPAPEPPEESEEEVDKATQAPAKRPKPASDSSKAAVVKKSGTFVRMKPPGKKPSQPGQ